MRIFLLYFPIILVKFACLKLSSLINENKTKADEINDSQQIEQNETKCEAKKNKLKNELTEVVSNKRLIALFLPTFFNIMKLRKTLKSIFETHF